MNVTIREEGPTTRVLELSLEPDEVDRHLDRVSAEYQRRAQLPGFRKGRVPRTLLEAKFGAGIQEEAVEAAVGEAYAKAIEEHQLVPVSSPRVADLSYKKGEPLAFRVTVEVRPTVEVTDYRGLEAKRRVREVPETEIEKALEQIRQETAVLTDLDRPATASDTVVVDHVRVDENGRTLKSTRVRDAILTLAEPGLLPEFRDGILGAAVGESRTLHVQYPEDFSNAELAGRRVRFHVRIKKVQEKKLRELDDNLAREIFGLESLAELRSRLRLQMEGEEKMRARRDLEEALVDALLARNAVAVPPGLAERLTGEALRRSGIDPAKLGEEDRSRVAEGFRRGVERRIAREWALEAVAAREGIDVASEELGEELSRIAQSRGAAGKEFRGLTPAERRQRVHDALLERKIFDFLIQEARVEEETVKEDPATV